MVAATFKTAMGHVLKYEGGLVNHPRDPGGLTNQGVTQGTYDAFRKKKGLKPRSVKSLTVEERDAIYDQQYWDVVKADALPKGVDFVTFDGAVNSGPIQSVKWVQRALGSRYKGAIDGYIANLTLEAIRQTNDVDDLVDRICDRRMAFLKALKTWDTFGRGWSRRVSSVRTVGMQLASSGPDPAPVPVPKPRPKPDPVELDPIDKEAQAPAVIEDRKPTPSTAGPDAAIGGGTVGGAGGAGGLDQVKDALEPVAGTSRWIDGLIVIVTITGIVVVLAGLAWRWYQVRKRKELQDALDLPVSSP